MALDAVLCDIDGTLLDTNPLHVEAWSQVFEAHGYRMGRDRIELEVGKGGHKLVSTILGREIADRDGDSLRGAHSEEFARLARARGVKLFPGAMQLLTALRSRELKVALATSSNQQHLRTLEMVSGVEFGVASDVIVTADHADESKPAPDFVVAALHELELSPAQCAMIGDTLHDMRAAKRAGVIGLGVLTGTQSRHGLLRAGARGVYADVAELLGGSARCCIWRRRPPSA